MRAPGCLFLATVYFPFPHHRLGQKHANKVKTNLTSVHTNAERAGSSGAVLLPDMTKHTVYMYSLLCRATIDQTRQWPWYLAAQRWEHIWPGEKATRSQYRHTALFHKSAKSIIVRNHLTAAKQQANQFEFPHGQCYCLLTLNRLSDSSGLP